MEDKTQCQYFVVCKSWEKEGNEKNDPINLM
jgi:hypothetical protein